MPQYLAKISNHTFTVDKQEARHLKVARVYCGQEIKIFDGKGSKYLAKTETLSDKAASGIILKPLPAAPLKREITLYFSAVSRSAAEDIIDKCTQAGVSIFVPVFSEYSDKDLLKKWQTKQERWQQIALAACKQCENPSLPQIMPPVSFEQAVKNLKMQAFICYESEQETSLLTCLQQTQDVCLALFIGPEGGYTLNETQLARQHNIKSVSLGRNILRAETAAAVACWAAQQ